MSLAFGGNMQVKSDPIWVIAARNNEKEKQLVYRVKGVRVSKQIFDLYKNHS